MQLDAGCAGLPRNRVRPVEQYAPFGTGTLLSDPLEKLRALELITNRIVPGRWESTRPPTEHELRETAVVAMPIDEASAKIRTGLPADTGADAHIEAWAGIVPILTTRGAPQPAPFSPEGAIPPSS